MTVNGSFNFPQDSGPTGATGPTGPTGSTGATGPAYGPVNISSDVTLTNLTLNFVDTSASRLLTLPAPSTALFITLKDIIGTASTHTVTLVRPGAQKIETVAADYVLSTDLFAITVISNGTDYFLI